MCQNPFFKCQTRQAKIVVDIIYKGTRYEICEFCWNKLAESDAEWGEPLPEPYYGPFPQEGSSDAKEF
jgi:hypothetical protein